MQHPWHKQCLSDCGQPDKGTSTGGNKVAASRITFSSLTYLDQIAVRISGTGAALWGRARLVLGVLRGLTACSPLFCLLAIRGRPAQPMLSPAPVMRGSGMCPGCEKLLDLLSCCVHASGTACTLEQNGSASCFSPFHLSTPPWHWGRKARCNTRALGGCSASCPACFSPVSLKLSWFILTVF